MLFVQFPNSSFASDPLTIYSIHLSGRFVNFSNMFLFLSFVILAISSFHVLSSVFYHFFVPVASLGIDRRIFLSISSILTGLCYKYAFILDWYSFIILSSFSNARKYTNTQMQNVPPHNGHTLEAYSTGNLRQEKSYK
jgi:hypothetical protein